MVTAISEELKPANERSETEVVRDARISIGNICIVVQRDLNEGGYYKVERGRALESMGNLSDRSVSDLVSIVNEIGIDRFTADETGDVPVFTYIDPRGRCFSAAYEHQQLDRGPVSRVHLAVAQSPDATPAIVMTMEDKILTDSVDGFRQYHTIDYRSTVGGAERNIRLVGSDNYQDGLRYRVQKRIDDWWESLQ